ncbi:poly(ADP-ribose) glycohydrolase [Acrasis kona]|uniref:poly(ADP-ribose) glycohydrolase n=1 Tax=Acrasis kona TaxID=1008807 RepID=A0AAW2ZA09_9EUKA
MSYQTTLNTWVKRKRDDSIQHNSYNVTPEQNNSEKKTPRKIGDNTSNAWNSTHVKLPCSVHNVHYNKLKRLSKWYMMKTVLAQKISSTCDFQDAVSAFNPTWENPDMDALHDFFSCYVTPEEHKKFFEDILPRSQKMALSLPNTCPQAIPLLRQQKEASVSLTGEQIACLIIHAMFCTFPKRNKAKDPKDEYYGFPSINFNTLYRSLDNSCHPNIAEKFKCLFFGYLDQITRPDDFRRDNVVTFERRVLEIDGQDDIKMWSQSKKALIPLTVRVDGNIEDDALRSCQVDFANKIVGGGVLGRGCVQEEIRFLISPECIISRLFTESLQDDECLLIRGAARYSNYTGYGDTFKYNGKYEHADCNSHVEEEIIVIDALNFPKSKYSPRDQYRPNLILRELQKAYCGFERPHFKNKTIATGNWGCGVFGGNRQLKSMIQWIAASEAGRKDMIYFAYGDSKLVGELQDMVQLLTNANATVGDVYCCLTSYRDQVRDIRDEDKPTIFQYMKTLFGPINVQMDETQ